MDDLFYDILRLIQDATPHPMTLAEITEATGQKRGKIVGRLNVLRERGYTQSVRYLSRTTTITERGRKALSDHESYLVSSQ